MIVQQNRAATMPRSSWKRLCQYT